MLKIWRRKRRKRIRREREYFCRRDFLTQYKALVAKNIPKLCIWVPIFQEERSEVVATILVYVRVCERAGVSAYGRVCTLAFVR